MTRKTRRLRRADRRGFTLVELMVTVFLLSVAITGLVGTSSAVSRMMGGSIREASAASLASSRFETLRGSQCTGIVSGTATTRGTTEKWVVTTINAKSLRRDGQRDLRSLRPQGRSPAGLSELREMLIASTRKSSRSTRAGASVSWKCSSSSCFSPSC